MLRKLALFGILLALCLGMVPAAFAQDAGTNALVQKIGAPAFFAPEAASCPTSADPAPLSCRWTRLVRGSSVNFLVINPDEGPGEPLVAGPGTALNNAYRRQIASAHAAGKQVFAFIRTRNGNTPLTQAKADVATYFNWYNDPANGVWLDGIFVDEVNPSLTTLPTYYRPLATYIRSRRTPAPKVIFNPAQHVVSNFLTAADIIVTVEKNYLDYRQYILGTPLSTLGWQANPANAGRIWHIVHTTSCPNYATDPASVCPRLRQVLNWAKERNAGYIYVTNGAGDNPYGSVPPVPYWRDENAYAALAIIP